jgi:molybdopterin converting factor small subunit
MPTARLLGPGLRRLVGGAEFELPGETVGALLGALAERGGETLRRQLFTDDAQHLNRDARILVNGRNAALLDGLATPLGERDTVTVYFFGARSFPGG